MTLNESKFDNILAGICQAEADGFSSYWVPTLWHDLVITTALACRVTQRIELGTAVVPIYLHHPVALARMALTLREVSNNRFTLGIGLSHQFHVQDRLGCDFSKPVLQMREYLTIVKGLVRGHWVEFDGQRYNVDTQLTFPGARPPQVLVAALGPQMLKLAGKLADGTITWMGGLRYLETQAVPLITQAARAAERPAPRIVAGIPIALTNQVESARASVAAEFAIHATLPSYRAILDVEGVRDAAGVSFIGTETEVALQMQRLADIGVTDLMAVVFDVKDDPGARQRTYDWLAALARGRCSVGPASLRGRFLPEAIPN